MRKLTTETPKFVEERRKRCDPNQPDPQAYGYGHAANPPNPSPSSTAASSPFALRAGMRRVDTSGSALSSLTTQSSGDMGGSPGGVHGSASYSDLLYRGSVPGAPASGTQGTLRSRGSTGKLRGVAAFAIASGLALLMRKNSVEKLPSAGGSVARTMSVSNGLSRRDRDRSIRRQRSSRVCFSEGGSALSLAEVEGL